MAVEAPTLWFVEPHFEDRNVPNSVAFHIAGLNWVSRSVVEPFFSLDLPDALLTYLKTTDPARAERGKRYIKLAQKNNIPVAVLSPDITSKSVPLAERDKLVVVGSNNMGIVDAAVKADLLPWISEIGSDQTEITHQA